jgi:hypothetical protein
MRSLIELLTGYADPKALYVGRAPVGKNGLTIRIRSIIYLATVIRCLDRDRFYRLGMNYCYDVYYAYVNCMKAVWQSEIVRIMDVPSITKKKVELENLTIRLMSRKFQSEPTISQSDKDEELRRFSALTDPYEKGGYKEFRDKFIAHIDLAHSLKPSANVGNLYQITDLILDWFKHVGTVILDAEPKFVTVGGKKQAREAVRQFRRMMFDQIRYRRQKYATYTGEDGSSPTE